MNELIEKFSQTSLHQIMKIDLSEYWLPENEETIAKYVHFTAEKTKGMVDMINSTKPIYA
jgi:predicted GTPase